MNRKSKNQFIKLAQGLNAPSDGAPAEKPARKEKPAAEPGAPDRSGEQIQISAYIPKELHKRVKIGLASQDEKLTLTELLIKLLSDWTNSQK